MYCTSAEVHGALYAKDQARAAVDSTGDKDKITEKSVLLRRQKEEYGNSPRLRDCLRSMSGHRLQGVAEVRRAGRAGRREKQK